MAAAPRRRAEERRLARPRTVREKLAALVIVSVGVAVALVPGALVLIGHAGAAPGSLAASLAASLVAAILALMLGLAVAWRMQRTITGPIVALTRSVTQRKVGELLLGSSDAATTAEIGDLVDSVNRMLGDIRARDVSIAAHVAGLEDEVASISSDLRLAKDARSAALASVGDEIRAPMTGVVAMAEMLALGQLPVRERRLAQVIAKSGSSLLASIDDLLEASLIEDGKVDLTPAPLDLAELVEDVCTLFWERAKAKGLDLAAYVDPAVPARLAADPVRLRQVIGVLLNNAIKLTETGGVLIEVEPDETAGVRICVHDTGVGVPKDRINAVFGRAGLGLANCKRLVDAMGGRLSVNSEVGRGSTFAFRLPAEVLEPAPPWPEGPKAGARVHLAVQGMSSRRALSRYLTRAGYSVASASGDRAALRIADPASLRRQVQDAVPTICIGIYGDAAPHDLQRAGYAQAVLIQPFRRGDLAALLRQVQAGELLNDPSADIGKTPAFGGASGLAPVRTAQVRARLVDPQVAAQLEAMAADGRTEFVSRVYGLYRENAPDSVVKLMDAASQGDAEGCAKAAHALKSMSFNIGATAVAELAEDIETAARNGTAPTALDLAELQSLLSATVAHASVAATPAARAEPASAIPAADAELLAEMEKGLAEEEMSLVYQPQVDRDGERIVGVEALLRWTHPVRGPISPAMFIPVAERYGLISRITNWVVDRLLAETRYLRGLQVAFNASAIEFGEPDFVDRIVGLIERHGYDPRRLEVEITETAILQNEVAVRRNIDRLRELGLKVALDDFGAGHSSLGHLRRYPFDKLKIDREFITDCSRDMQAATIVHAVVSIGRALGMKVIAEGVETETQRKFLKVAGVHAMQGYLFGKPVSVDELAFMLSRKERLERA